MQAIYCYRWPEKWTVFFLFCYYSFVFVIVVNSCHGDQKFSCKMKLRLVFFACHPKWCLRWQLFVWTSILLGGWQEKFSSKILVRLDQYFYSCIFDSKLLLTNILLIFYNRKIVFKFKNLKPINTKANVKEKIYSHNKYLSQIISINVNL